MHTSRMTFRRLAAAGVLMLACWLWADSAQAQANCNLKPWLPACQEQPDPDAPPVLPAPTNLQATPVGQTTVTLRWSDRANDEDAYVVSGTRIAAHPGTGVMSHTITGLAPGTR